MRRAGAEQTVNLSKVSIEENETGGQIGASLAATPPKQASP
jgi:hypothetical protein